MFCLFCGYRLDSDSSFCPFCGKKVAGSITKNNSTTSNNAQTSKRTNTDMPVFTPPVEELSLFKTQKMLGASRTSKVFRLMPKTDYALKVVEITGQKAERAVDNEYRIARLLDDERYFVSYYAMYKQGDKAYIVQPELRNLPDYISEEHPDLRCILKILQDAARAIAILQEKGIVHLDVKPKNIFVDGTGQGKLGDFSTACEIASFAEKPYWGGTPKYFPPEVYKSLGYSGKEDMYSFGITMYYILSGGKYPYDFTDEVTRTAESEYIANGNIPDELQSVIQKATAYNPGDRYDGMAELCEELDLVCQNLSEKPVTGTCFCRVCGAECDPTVTFCTNCGSRLKGANSSYPLPVEQSRSSSSMEDYSLAYGYSESASYGDTGGTTAPGYQATLEISKVHFSAIAPQTLIKGDYTIIDIVMYQDAFRSIVDELIKEAEVPVHETRSGAVKVKEGVKVKIQLSSPDIPIEDNIEEQEWAGEYLIFNFAVMLPEKYAKRQVLFTATVYIDDVIATRLKFIAKCWSLRQQKIKVTQEDVPSAFVSYASQDRNRVAMIIQGMQKARPDMDIFFDVESLRSGEAWEEALWSEIDQRDILFLCWSHNAAESPWVAREWKYCYEQKGAEAIEPIPLEPPSSCPPPEELKSKHFNDRLLYVIKAESADGNGSEKDEDSDDTRLLGDSWI